MHSDSDINEEIFASATTAGRTSKFNPKPRINIKKALPMSSKSGPAEVPASTSKFPSSEDISYNILDEAPQLDIGASQEGTDMSSHLVSLDGSILTFSTSASSVGGSQLSAISQFESRESEQPANLDQVVGDSIEVLTVVYGSSLQSSSDIHPTIKPSRNLEEVVPVESAQNGANASQAFADIQDSEETTTSASLDESLFDINASSGRKSKFRPKIRQKIVKCISASSNSIKTSLEPPCAPDVRSQERSRLGLSTLVTSACNTCNYEVHELPESSSFLDSTFSDDNDRTSQMDEGKLGKAPDLFANVETANVSIKQASTSVSSEPEVTQSPLVVEEFAARQAASYSSERVANLQTDSDKPGEELTTGHSGLEPLDDLLLQSVLPAVKQIGKFLPKSALAVEGKKAKSVSFILPNDGESAASVEHQPEMATSSPIERITSFVEMMSDQNINVSVSSLPNCYKNNQVDLPYSVREDVMDISGLDTVDIISEPILNSDQHVDKSEPDLQAIKKNARINVGINPDAISSAPISPGDIESGFCQLDSLSMNRESLGVHGPDFPSSDLIESFTPQSYNCMPSNLNEEGACFANHSDLGGQSLGGNEDLHTMEGETTIDVSLNHFEEPALERSTPSIVQDEVGKSSRRFPQRNRKLKSSLADNKTSEYQNFENTAIPEMDEENSHNGYKDEDVPKKKKRKAPRKSSSTSSEHERSIKSRRKASEEPDSTVKDPPKKRLPHGSRRKSARRQVNKTLLEIPDDELDRRQLVIRDLIRLAGFKERVSNKEAAAMKNSFTNQSNTFTNNSHLNYENYHEEELGQGTTGDDTNEEIQQEAPKLNYHTYMTRPQQTRWSKTDTELFYQAVRQFGTDFAMVQLLFPNRSRQQVKAKFKNEQRKHPLQIADALVCRSKDHSHFEKVIQHLQAVAEQKSKNEASSDPITESQDVADENEEEIIEANKKEQDVSGIEDVEEWSSLKSNYRNGDDHTPTKLGGYRDCF